LGTAPPESRDRLFDELCSWMERAKAAGLDGEDILALFAGAQEASAIRSA
jgi:hypothetical protein